MISNLAIDFALDRAVSAFGGIQKVSPYLSEDSKFLGEDMGVFIFQGEKRWTSLLTRYGYTFTNPNTNAGNGQNWNAGFFAGDIGGYQQGAWALAIAVDPNTSLDYMNQLKGHYLGISDNINAPVYVDWGGTRIKYYRGTVSIWNPPLTLD